MNVCYDLKRVCGSVYSNGNIIFTPDGNSVLSPVGAQVNVFNLVEQTTKTLKFENRKNIKRIVLSHNGRFLITVDIEGHALFINYQRQVILHRFHFKRKVYDIKFSPDDEYFTVTFGHTIQLWRTPSAVREFSPLILKRTLGGFNDDTTCIDWSTDSNCILIGSKDLTIRIYVYVKSKRMFMHTLSGHRDKVMGTYFNHTNDMVYTIARDGAVFSWKLESVQPASIVEQVRTNNDDDDGEGSSDESESSSYMNSNNNSDNDTDDEGNYTNTNTALPAKPTPKYHSTPSKSTSNKAYKQWILQSKEFVWDQKCHITSTTYQKTHSLLIIGFANGVYGLYEMPGCINIQRLSISNSIITTSAITPSGEWIALGCSELGQLVLLHSIYRYGIL